MEYSSSLTIKINLEDFLYQVKEESIEAFNINAEDRSPSLVEYELSSMFQDYSYSQEKEIIQSNKIKNLYPFGSTQVIIDYNENIYLRKIKYEHEEVYSLF